MRANKKSHPIIMTMGKLFKIATSDTITEFSLVNAILDMDARTHTIIFYVEKGPPKKKFWKGLVFNLTFWHWLLRGNKYAAWKQ